MFKNLLCPVMLYLELKISVQSFCTDNQIEPHKAEVSPPMDKALH